ncbi:MAG TPA: adenosylcobinamide-GDP ribazoletransferase [Bryobacteraceae bacterium]|nr:adenosylcobinamide-GDP ribazoletransferase [Bryobacteraceae bacterium]
MRRLLGAIQFLTVLPVGARTATPGESALFFPLVGAGLGWLGAQWLGMLSPWLGSTLAALLILVFWALVTGALHEDGLADVADAIRAHRSPERMITILKDSRIGAFGALALILVVAIRWQAIVRMPAAPVAELAACLAVSRAAMVGQAFLSRPIGEGMGAAFASRLSTWTASIAILQGIAAAFLPGLRVGLVLVSGAVFVTWVLYRWFDARLGGVNGDCLGATCLMVETFSMILVSCRNCYW